MDSAEQLAGKLRTHSTRSELTAGNWLHVTLDSGQVLSALTVVLLPGGGAIIRPLDRHDRELPIAELKEHHAPFTVCYSSRVEMERAEKACGVVSIDAPDACLRPTPAMRSYEPASPLQPVKHFLDKD